MRRCVLSDLYHCTCVLQPVFHTPPPPPSGSNYSRSQALKLRHVATFNVAMSQRRAKVKFSAGKDKGSICRQKPATMHRFTGQLTQQAEEDPHQLRGKMILIQPTLLQVVRKILSEFGMLECMMCTKVGSSVATDMSMQSPLTLL